MTRRRSPRPGLYYDVPFEDYCDWDAVNNSSLTPMIRRSPAHYKHGLENPREQTVAMAIGSLCHQAKLEPLLIPQQYVVMPDLTDGILTKDGAVPKNVKSTSEYKRRVAEFRELHTDKEIVDRDTYDRVLGVTTALSAHPEASRLINGSHKELSMIWKCGKIKCKGRVDIYRERQWIADIKTTDDLSEFERSIAKFSYHRQVAFYQDGLATVATKGELLPFYLIVVEKHAPFGVCVAPVDQEAIEAGRAEYMRGLSLIEDCRKSGQWPNYADPPCWKLPGWAQNGKPVTVEIDGELVEV